MEAIVNLDTVNKEILLEFIVAYTLHNRNRIYLTPFYCYLNWLLHCKQRGSWMICPQYKTSLIKKHLILSTDIGVT